jgi:hypothetical protein
MIVLLVG